MQYWRLALVRAFFIGIGLNVDTPATSDLIAHFMSPVKRIMTLQHKTAELRRILTSMESLLIGYSGGIDSTLVAKLAHETLGAGMLAVIGDSESLLPSELEEAKELVELEGIPYRIIHPRELDNPNYSSNPSNRCFFCKDELFTMLRDLATKEGFRFIADGANADDAGDHRPGLQAAAEHQVRHPLQEAGFTKNDVRELARELGLSNWDKPAMACLASRFPYGTEISQKKLAMVAEAEETLKALGFRNYRVRHHESGKDTIARIELSDDDFDRILDSKTRAEIDTALRKAGYQFVALDLQDFRSGRLNDSLKKQLVQLKT